MTAIAVASGIGALLAVAALPAAWWLGRHDALLDAAQRERERHAMAADPPAQRGGDQLTALWDALQRDRGMQ